MRSVQPPPPVPSRSGRCAACLRGRVAVGRGILASVLFFLSPLSPLSLLFFYRSAEHFHILLWQRARLHSRIGDDVRGFAFGQQLACFRVSQLVSETDHFLPHMFQVRAHDDLVIIVYGSLVAGLGIDNGDKAIVFALHFLIAEAELAHEFDTSYFKPDEMIGVIDEAHLVGFGVADAEASLVRRRPLTYICRYRCIVPGHRPVHFGLRFSRNDSIPSRKSALWRMPAFSRMADSICASSSARARSVSRRLVWKSESGLFSASC